MADSSEPAFLFLYRKEAVAPHPINKLEKKCELNKNMS